MIWISVDAENKKQPVLERFLWESEKGKLKLIVLGDPFRREVLLELGFGKQTPYASCHGFAPRLEKRQPVNYMPSSLVYDFLLLCVAELTDKIMFSKKGIKSYASFGDEKRFTNKTWIINSEPVIEKSNGQFKRSIVLTVDKSDSIFLSKLSEEEPFGKHWYDIRIPWFVTTCDKNLILARKRMKSFFAMKIIFSQQENIGFLRLPILKESYSRIKDKEIFLDFLGWAYPKLYENMINSLGKKPFEYEGGREIGRRYLSFAFKEYKRRNGASILRLFPAETDKTLPNWLEELIRNELNKEEAIERNKETVSAAKT